MTQPTPSADPPNGALVPTGPRLHREHEFLQAIIDAIPVMITVCEPDTRVLRLNPEFERVTGWTNASAGGASLMELCYPDPAYREEVGRFMQACAGGWRDVRMRTRDGRDIETCWANIRLSDGTQVGIGLDVAERRRAEAALRESEARYRDLFENANDIIYTLDLDGRLTSMNRRAEETFGFTRDEFVGRNVLEMVPPEHHPALYEARRSKLAGGASPTVYEIEVMCKDGRLVPLEINSRLIYRDGVPVGIQGIARDISDRRRAELAMQRSELRFRQLVDQAPLSIQILAPDGRTLRVNRAWEQLWGSTFEEHLTDYNMLQDAQLRTRGIMPYVERAFAGESVKIPPVAYVPDRGAYRGQERWIRAVMYPVRNERGRIEEVVLIQEDITEQRQALEAMGKSEERLRLALDAGQCGVWDWDIVADKVTWSERIYEFHGVPAGSIDGPLDNFSHMVHAEDADFAREAIRQAVEEGKPYNVEFRIVRPSGEIRWLASRGEVVFDDNGRPLRMLGAAIDVTERRAAEEALREADRRKDEFMAMLAHELRNPLAPIRNAAQVLKLIGGSDPNLGRARDMIDRQVGHMARLVDDLLDVSRISRGKILLRRQLIDLVPVVRVAVEDHRALLEGTGLTLTVDLPAQSVWVNGDQTRLAQVVGNLLHNANKFTDTSGHVTVRLTVEPADAGGLGSAVITVRDTGIGIDAGMLPRLFEPFSQADRSLDRSRGGLGLGLALVKGLIDLHGGSVHAASAGLGQGAEFTLRLPLSLPPARARTRRPSSRADGRSLRVLVVEDNRDMADSMRMLLEMAGHQVTLAHSGPAGLEAARREHPDVLLCDIGLPGGMDGYRVARALRSDLELATIPLIAISGYGQDEDQRLAQEAGFDRHLTKPVEPAVLTQVIEEVARIARRLS